jgi:hypothetical protein
MQRTRILDLSHPLVLFVQTQIDGRSSSLSPAESIKPNRLTHLMELGSTPELIHALYASQFLRT